MSLPRVPGAGSADIATGVLVAPVDDPIYRAVALARDPSVLLTAIRNAWRGSGSTLEILDACLTLVHYRPRQRARLMVQLKVEMPKRRKGSATQHLYIQVYPKLETARRRCAQVLASPLRCLGPAAFVIEEWRAMACALPNGPLLRTAKMLMRKAAFARFLAEAGLAIPGAPRSKKPRLIRYVPRHRTVFRTGQPCGSFQGRCYIKVYSRLGDMAAAENLRLAQEAASTADFEVPRLIAHVTRRRALVMAEITGRSLTEVLAAGEDAAFSAVGRALAGLHSSRIAPARTWVVGDEMTALGMAMRDMAIALPSLSATLGSFMRDIDSQQATLKFPTDRPIHANMFGDQVIVKDDGSIGIVDWDDLCLGDPLFDVGRLAAHVLFVSLRTPEGTRAAEDPIRALLSAHSSAGGPLDVRRLRWHVATALLLRAKISALRSLPKAWLLDIERSVLLVQGILADRATPGLPS